MLSQMNQGKPSPALIPLPGSSRDYDQEEYERPRGRKRRDSPSPPPKLKATKQKKRPRTPSLSSSEESESSGSDYSSYDEPENVKQKFAKEPCEYISPATLNSKQTKKEVVNYLEEKQCPKIETHAKKRKHIPPATVSSPASPPAAQPPAPAPVPKSDNTAAVPPPASTVKAVEKPKVGRPKKPEDPNKKPKRAPTEYNMLIKKHRDAGLTFGEAAKEAKKEWDVLKKKLYSSE